jgi:hypothetical protein
VRVVCHSEPRDIVNNQRKLVWQFRCTYTHSVLNGPAQSRRAGIMSDVMMLQCLAERAVPSGSRAEGPPKVAEMAVLGVFFERSYTGVCVGSETEIVSVLRSELAIVQASEPSVANGQGVHRTSIDKRLAPARAVCLSFFPIILCAMPPAPVFVPTRDID